MSSNVKKNIADQVFDILSNAIVEGEIAAGSKISEPELARRLAVSRASLREAIARLEACSLVTRRANIGARVVSLSKTQLLEIYHVREALEGMAARLAAEHASTEELQQLRHLLQRHSDEVKKVDGDSYFQRSGDLDFHYHIVRSSHNERLISLLCNDLYHLMRMYRYQFGRVSQRAFPALEEHGYIVSAICDRDPEMAELLMRNHIRRSRRNIEQMMAG